LPWAGKGALALPADQGKAAELQVTATSLPFSREALRLREIRKELHAIHLTGRGDLYGEGKNTQKHRYGGSSGADKNSRIDPVSRRCGYFPCKPSFAAASRAEKTAVSPVVSSTLESRAG
jgi:hypothetical protein